MKNTTLNIWKALKARIGTMKVPAGTVIFYPADKQGAAANIRHIKVTLLTTPPERRELADRRPQHHRGTLRLLYNVPLETVNFEATLLQAGEMAESFRECVRGFGLSLRVVEDPTLEEGYQEDGWWKTPIVVRWETAA